MHWKDLIKDIADRQHLTLKEVATMAGMSYNGLHDKFRRGSITVRDLEKILSVLGKELRIVDKQQHRSNNNDNKQEP